MTTMAEVLLGRIVDLPIWSKFTSRELPTYQMPAQLRTLNPALRYEPIVELVDSVDAPTCALRIGPQVIRYQRIRSYSGWVQFKPELDRVVDTLFDKAQNLVIRRLGLRYANALRSDAHRVHGLASMDITTTIAGESLTSQTNLNFNRFPSVDMVASVKVATADIVVGPLPPNTTVYIDCDVFTPDGYSTKDKAAVGVWIQGAHEVAKREFFTLLTEQVISFLDSGAKP